MFDLVFFFMVRGPPETKTGRSVGGVKGVKGTVEFQGERTGYILVLA